MLSAHVCCWIFFVLNFFDTNFFPRFIYLIIFIVHTHISLSDDFYKNSHSHPSKPANQPTHEQTHTQYIVKLADVFHHHKKNNKKNNNESEWEMRWEEMKCVYNINKMPPP